jgi:hypothetical protein
MATNNGDMWLSKSVGKDHRVMVDRGDVWLREAPHIENAVSIDI